MRHRKSSTDIATIAIPYPEPLLVTTAHAAELLSISPWEVRRLVRKGLLAHKKLSKTHWLIPMKSVREFAEVPANGRAA
jgi:excisionase family DNA binding protein